MTAVIPHSRVCRGGTSADVVTKSRQAPRKEKNSFVISTLFDIVDRFRDLQIGGHSLFWQSAHGSCAWQRCWSHLASGYLPRRQAAASLKLHRLASVRTRCRHLPRRRAAASLKLHRLASVRTRCRHLPRRQAAASLKHGVTPAGVSITILRLPRRQAAASLKHRPNGLPYTEGAPDLPRAKPRLIEAS